MEKTNIKFCESVANIIDYEQYEILGKDFYELGSYANNDDCSNALALTAKNYLTFSAILELSPSMTLNKEFDAIYKPTIDYYFNEYNENDTPLYDQGIMTKSFYIAYFFNDLQKINSIRETNRKNKNERSKVKLLKSEILYLTSCDYYFNYFVGAYIAKLMLHLQVESNEEYEIVRKFMKTSINNKNHELIEFVFYRIDNRDESIIKSFDDKFGEQIIDDAMTEVSILDIINNYIANVKDIAAITNENKETASLNEGKKKFIISLFENKKKKSS